MVGTNTVLAGMYRLVHRDNNDNTIRELFEKHSSEFGYQALTAAVATVNAAIPTNPEQMVKVKKDNRALGEDDKLVIMFKPDASITSLGAVPRVRNIRIPITIRNTRSGNVYEKTLIASDFTDKQVPTAGKVLVAGVWCDLESMTVSAQNQIKLGHKLQDVRVDSACLIHESMETA